MPEITPSKYLVTAGWNDIPHLDAKTKAELLAATPVHLRKARSEGIPALGSGAIFALDEESITCDPIRVPEHWAQIIGLDFGWDHPTAAANLAWDRDLDVVYLTATYKKSEATPAIHALAIKPWGTWKPVAWPHDGLQHDKGSGEQLAAQYKTQGLNMLRAQASHAPQKGQPEGSGGNGVEAGLMEMLDRMQSGRFKVFKTCTDWLAEFRLYHRKDGKIVKEFDDAISASRYALMMIRFAKTKPSQQQSRVPVYRGSTLGMGSLG